MKREHLSISVDDRGRAFDNIFVERLWRSVKHEDVYLNGYANMGELMVGLTVYMNFYNVECAYQSPGYLTPQQVYQAGIGGAIIIDKFGKCVN